MNANTPDPIRAVDLPRLVRLLRGRDRHYNASELMTMAADALESLMRDKERIDWLETQDCWVGICGDYYAEAVNSCGGCYAKKVRAVCDEYLPNVADQATASGGRSNT